MICPLSVITVHTKQSNIHGSLVYFFYTSSHIESDFSLVLLIILKGRDSCHVGQLPSCRSASPDQAHGLSLLGTSPVNWRHLGISDDLRQHPQIIMTPAVPIVIHRLLSLIPRLLAKLTNSSFHPPGYTD